MRISILHAIDLVVAAADVGGLLGIHVDQRVDAVAEHGLRLGPHRPQVEGQLDPGFADQGPGLAGDVDRHVADPLQIVVDLHGGDDQPQIDGHRLMEGQGLHALLLHLDLAVIDVQVALLDLAGQGLVALQDRPQGHLHLVLHQGAEREDVLLEFVDFSLQVGRHGWFPGSARSPALQ